jgi:hypothetical protein
MAAPVTIVITIAWDRKSITAADTAAAVSIVRLFGFANAFVRLTTRIGFAAARPIPGEDLSIPPIPWPDIAPGAAVTAPTTGWPGATMPVTIVCGTPVIAKVISALAICCAAKGG